MEPRENTSQSPVESGRGSVFSTIPHVSGCGGHCGACVVCGAHRCVCAEFDETLPPSAALPGVDMPGVGHVPMVIPGTPYVSDGSPQEVPEPLRSFLSGERIDLEITPAGVIGLQELAAAKAGVDEVFGEPWRFNVNALDEVRIYDGCGHLVCLISSKCFREALDWAERICAAVNFCAGLPEPDLALSEPLAARFPFLTVSSPSIADAIVKDVIAKVVEA